MAKRFSVYVDIGGRVGSSFTSAIATVENRLNGLSRKFQASALAAKSAFKQIGESAKGIAGLAAAGGLSFGIKHALGAGAELAHEIQALKNAGRTAKEVAEGIAEANRVIGRLPTTTLAENLKVLNETTGAFGDYHHALENLEFNQRIGSILQNSIGAKAGDPGEMFNSLVRAFEIRGTAADHHVYQKEVGELARAMIFTRGNVNPQEMLNFAQQANPAIKNYSERFLTKIAPSLIQEFGGERAGTRAGAWYNAIMGKTRDKRMADAWVKLGMLDKKNVLTNKKTGDIIGWNPGAMKGTDEAMADPLAWTEKYLIPALKKAGIDTDNQMAVTKELGKLFRNSEANRFANAITQLRDRKRLHKDEGLINAVPDADKAYEDTLLNDPKFAKLAARSALTNIGESLTVVLMPAIARSLTAIARALNSVAQVFIANPDLAKVVAGVMTALAAAATVKLAGLILGVTGLGRALVFLGIAAPLSLAARLLGIGRAITALSAAAALGAAARLRGLAAGIIALGAVGGSSALFGAAGGAIAGAIGALGRAMLFVLNPMNIFRAALAGLRLVFHPMAAAILAVVAALAALAVWTSNNWNGIKTFLASFGEAFSKSLGPQASGAITAVSTALQSAWDWLMKLLGPIDETGKKWASWGTSAGTAAAAVVNALAGLPAKIGALAKQGSDALINFDWAGAGAALVGKIADGVTGAAGALGKALTSAATSAWDRAKKALGIGGDEPVPAPGAPAKAGAGLEARATGGPVNRGQPYLVGERGPEIFVPNGSGRIETNGTLRGLTGGGGKGGLAVPVDTSSIERAGAEARRSGAVIEASLDKTVKPIVDTASIDEAITKAERLKLNLASADGNSINLGGAASGGAIARAGGAVGGGGGSGGARTAGPMPGAGDGLRGEVRAYLRTAAASNGIDPNVAERVMNQESKFNPYARNINAKERSYGVMQLNTKGGLGAVAQKQGIDPTDPSQWRKHIDFSLGVVKRDGWRQWYGARDVGISRWQGIAGRRALGGPVQGGLSYLVGERGPEIFTPGATGGISTNGTLKKLADLGSRAISTEDGGTSPKLAPSPEKVAQYRPQGGNTITHGDRHYSPTFHINGAQKPESMRQEMETMFFDFIRRIESDQRGSLSD